MPPGVRTPAWATANVTGLANSTDAGLSAAAVAGVGVGSAIGGMTLLAAVGALLLSTHFGRRMLSKHHQSNRYKRRSHRAEMPGFQTDAKEADVVSPISPSSMTKDGRSPIETTLSRSEQDELHALRERMRRMRLELAMLEERERMELDGGIDGLKEMPA